MLPISHGHAKQEPRRPEPPEVSRIVEGECEPCTLPAETRLVSLAETTERMLISGGDLLLFRNTNPISIAGRGKHTHAAMASWWGGRLFCIEVREWVGGRAVTLASQVRKFPGRIDVFQANSVHDRNWNRMDAQEAMRSLAGCAYGYGNVLRASLSHLFGTRLFTKPSMNDCLQGNKPPFCSEAIAWAHRMAGFDPVPNLADRYTEPADLARSNFFRKYKFTLE